MVLFDYMKLSFVILNYKTKNLLRLCLKNILKLNLPFAYEIIVVDNASKEDLRDIQELYPRVKFIFSKTNLGHGAGNNIGIKNSSGEYIAVVNPDIIFTRQQDFIDILNFLDAQPAIAILGPQLKNPDGAVQCSCLRPYSFWTPIYRRTPLGILPWAKKDIARHLMEDFDHTENREVEWILGACMFLRRSALEKIGLFNASFFLYFADYELCDRARKNGFKVIYFAKTAIIHYHKRESAQKSFLSNLFSYPTRVHIKDWLTYLKNE